MSGTGGPSPAEHHLGDRLAALVDGELGHDARERVLAHLATCCKCRAEADAQRQVKTVFAETAPPGPSEGLLARLQGLPGGAAGPGNRLGGGALGGGDFARGAFAGGDFGGDLSGDFGAERGFGHVPSGSHAIDGVPRQPRNRGFRIHESERTAPQRRRFAFAAAGAVSLAAFALGGALPLEAAVESAGGRAEGPGTAVTPAGQTPMAVAGRQAGRSEELLAAGDPRARAVPAGSSSTALPAPSPMGLYGPSASLPARSAALPPRAGVVLSPVTGPTGPTVVDRTMVDRLSLITLATPLDHGAPEGPPLPPLEPKRPLITTTPTAAPDRGTATR
ncbi:zf-HC2 domain-containing protein [Streptomyces sp. MST-110588]|uniref:zf-HC2 domain-containing protein n=1 Tax=Streptomyces sp. MST-110588 TaxID=2833628 RepID=UPI001F5D2009|nr:zf-HC2 domain-containing protein [Streptomyces sp. MST-110588]UNO40070.1 zf-HC2 domain-containing protein [Streptomyces sp. MST-110588]